MRARNVKKPYYLLGNSNVFCVTVCLNLEFVYKQKTIKENVLDMQGKSWFIVIVTETILWVILM